MSEQPALTAAEYQAATNELRALQSVIVQSELKAVRDRIAHLKTAAGKTQERSHAHQVATKYFETARLADIAAHQYFLKDRYGDTPEMGRARLEAATAEAWGADVRTNRKRRRTPEHGDWNKYRAGCHCDECRKANAKRVAEYRATKRAQAWK